MPYYVKGKWVYKKDTHEKVGCTEGSVNDYLAALHMHANGDVKNKRRRITAKSKRRY